MFLKCARMKLAAILMLTLLPVRIMAADIVNMTEAELADRIEGGVLGQILGNLNGLEHEFRYIDSPGNVSKYTPSLPEGAFTDDDTDIEWVYLVEMERSGELFLSPHRMRTLWVRHINDWIWSANNSARHLMRLELDPPDTGNGVLNPWAETNVGGLFLSEMFSLASPAMPQTAGKLATYYARASVDGEPIQSTQFSSTVVSLAFVEQDISKLLDAGELAVDPDCHVADIIRFARKQVRKHPDDWRAARLAVRNRFTQYGGIRPELNGYALNTAAAVCALEYGRGDFIETLKLAFNFGWDADNTAAFCGTVLGVIHGRKWIAEQGWHIQDLYRNTRRDEMPNDETISGYARRIQKIARQVIEENGGQRQTQGDRNTFLISRQEPQNMEKFTSHMDQKQQLLEKWGPRLERDLTQGSNLERARAVYLAICLGKVSELSSKHPGAWGWGVQRLERYNPEIVIEIFTAPLPYGEQLRNAAKDAKILRVSQ